MKKLKNGSHFVNINRTEKFQITDPPKVWVSSFPGVDRNGISASAVMKKLKNGSHFVNIDHTEKFQITDPPKVWVSGFPGVDGVYPTSHLCVVLHFLILFTFISNVIWVHILQFIEVQFLLTFQLTLGTLTLRISFGYFLLNKCKE